MKKTILLLCCLLGWMVLFLPPGQAATPPAPSREIYLVDDAAMVTPEDRETLLSLGRELDDRTGAQIVVVTMETLGGEDIDTYANQLFRGWGIGDRQKNNGVLLLIAKEDRKFRIEVGYGLEGTITDGCAGEILDGMKSYFRSEEYSTGILRAYQKLARKAYEAEDMEPPEALASAGEDEEWTWVDILCIIGCIILILFLIFGGATYLFALVIYGAGLLLTWCLYLLTSGAVDYTDKFKLDDDSGSGGRRSRGGGSGSDDYYDSGSSDDDYGGGDSGGGGASDDW